MKYAKRILTAYLKLSFLVSLEAIENIKLRRSETLFDKKFQYRFRKQAHLIDDIRNTSSFNNKTIFDKFAQFL
jgi:hypothetical protein